VRVVAIPRIIVRLFGHVSGRLRVWLIFFIPVVVVILPVHRETWFALTPTQINSAFVCFIIAERHQGIED